MFRSRHKNGHYLWVEGVIVNLLQDESGKAIVFNFRDITGRVEAEENLREQSARLQAISDNLPGIMIYQLVGDCFDHRKFTYLSNGIIQLI